MPIVCDGILYKNIVNEFASAVSILNVSKGSYNIYGDATTSTTVTTGSAVLNYLTHDDDLVKEGHFQAGDLVLYFDNSTGTICDRNDFIIKNSSTYTVDSIIQHECNNSIYVVEVRARKS